MVARGELILRDSQGLEQRFELIVTAEKFEQGGEIARFFSDPSNVILTMSGLLSLSVLLGMNIRKKGSGKVATNGRAKETQKLENFSSLRPNDKPATGTLNYNYINENNAQRPNSIGDGVEDFSGPNRPGEVPQKMNRVEVTYDPNHIPDLDEVI